MSTAAQRLALLGHTGARVTRPRPLTGTRPLVSVVIPCYNYGHYLPGCVASVLDQPGVDLDVVIVDDASPDGSAETVRRLVASDPRLRAIYHETNQGHIATYNDGLATVRGEYVLLLSADDLLVPGALGRAAALMEAHPSVGLVYGATVDFTGTPPPARTDATSWIVWRGSDWLAGRCRSGRNPLLSPEAVMRTSVLRKLGGYRADLPHAADFAMWLGAAMVSDIGYVGGADQAYYRVHAQSMSKTVNAGMVIDIQQRLLTFDVTLAGDRTLTGAAIPVAARDLLNAAHRALARQALEHAIAACLAAAGPAAPGDAIRADGSGRTDDAGRADGSGQADGSSRANEAGRADGAGKVGAGKVGAGMVDAGKVDAGVVGAGKVDAGNVGAGPAGAEAAAVVDRLVDVAVAAYPAVTDLPEWGVLQQVRNLGGDALRRSPSLRARRLAYDLGDRLRWRRWRQVGV